MENDVEVVNIDLDIDDLVDGSANTLVVGDFIAVSDGGTTEKHTFTSVFNDMNVPNLSNFSSAHFVTRTANDVYTEVNLAVAGAGALDGLDVSGTLASGTITFGLDIDGLTENTVISDTDELVIFDGTNNRKITVAELIADIDNETIVSSDGDTKVTTADSGQGTIANTVEITVGGSLDYTFDGTKFELLNGSVIHNEEGTEALPGYTFTGATDSGMYLTAGDGDVCIAVDAKDILCLRIQSGATGDEHLVIEAGDGEGRLVAEGDATNVDIRIVPKGTGSVFLGDPGTSATIKTSDGEDPTDDGENLTIQTGAGNTTGQGGDILILAGDGGGTAGSDGGDITLTPGSSANNDVDGIVCITDDDSVNVTCFEGVETAVNSFVMTNAATGDGPILEAEGGDTNIDIEFLPKGTGVLSIDTDVISATDYRNNLTDDSNDIPNTAYVKELADAAAASVQKTLYSTVDNAGVIATTINIPLNADITRVVVNITTPYLGSTGFDLETAATADRVAADSEGLVDWQTTGVYVVENFENVSLAASDFALGIQGGASAAGVATIRVEFTVDV